MGPMNGERPDLRPVVVQDAETNAVLMLAWANAEALAETRARGVAVFYSRARATLWEKGETSGNRMYIEEIREDCDQDALLYRVRPTGPACHTGAESCFFRPLPGTELAALFGRIEARRSADSASSYTRRLLDAGLDRILRKVGEESGEVIIAAKNEDTDALVGEAVDLLYHLFVALSARGVDLARLEAEVARRAGERVAPAP
jgi:phosphoribosyl-ATP pyrophosphohydrolase/phosphoribosyl-AMP cyclohydrolase